MHTRQLNIAVCVVAYPCSCTPLVIAARSDLIYELIYWPGALGRREHIRLVLGEAGASYSDTPRFDAQKRADIV